MGSLCRLLLSVDQQINLRPGVEDENDVEPLHIEEAVELLEQSVLLLGQCHNMITYERHKNVLGSVLSGSAQVATMLKDKKDLLQKNEDGMLFGKEFKDQIKQCAVDKKKSREVFGMSSRKPFREGPSYHKSVKGSVYEGHNQTKYGNNYFNRGFTKRQGNYGKRKLVFSESTSLQQQNESSKTDELGGFDSSSSNCKENVSKSRNSIYPFSREVKTFSTSVGKIDSRPKSTLYGRRSKNTPFVETYSEEGPTSDKFQLPTKGVSSAGTSGDAAKRCNFFSNSLSRGVSEQYPSSSQEGWGQSCRAATCDKSKKFESLHSLRAFQDRELTLPERYSAA